MVEVQLLDILSVSFQIIDLEQLLFKGVLKPLIFGLELLDAVEQLHLVALEGGVLEDEALMLLEAGALEGDDSGAVLGDKWQVALHDLLSHLLHV
jgi:hypothetical protein